MKKEHTDPSLKTEIIPPTIKESSQKIDSYFINNPADLLKVKTQYADIGDIMYGLNSLYGPSGLLGIIISPDPYKILSILGFDPSAQVKYFPKQNLDSLSDRDSELVSLVQGSFGVKSSEPVLLLPKDASISHIKRFISNSSSEMIDYAGGHKAFKFSVLDSIFPGRRRKLIEKINTFLVNKKNKKAQASIQDIEKIIGRIAAYIAEIISETTDDPILETLRLGEEGLLTQNLLKLVAPDPALSSEDNIKKFHDNTRNISELKHTIKKFEAAEDVIHESIDESILEDVFKILTPDQKRQVAQTLVQNLEAAFSKHDINKLRQLLS